MIKNLMMCSFVFGMITMFLILRLSGFLSGSGDGMILLVLAWIASIAVLRFSYYATSTELRRLTGARKAS